MANITVTQEVTEVNITVTQNGDSYTLQPVLVVGSSGGGGDMLKAVYDPANKEEQVLTISDIIDGGAL